MRKFKKIRKSVFSKIDLAFPAFKSPLEIEGRILIYTQHITQIQWLISSSTSYAFHKRINICAIHVSQNKTINSCWLIRAGPIQKSIENHFKREQMTPTTKNWKNEKESQSEKFYFIFQRKKFFFSQCWTYTRYESVFFDRWINKWAEKKISQRKSSFTYCSHI